MTPISVEHALAVKRRHEAALLRRANVVAVGVGRRVRGGAPTEEVCIVVSVRRKQPATALPPAEVLPARLEDVPVDVVEAGEIAAW